MFIQIFGSVIGAISSVLGFFGSIVARLDVWPYIFASIGAMLVIRFLIYPMLKEGVAKKGNE